MQQMLLKTTKFLNIFVVLLMTVEFMGAAFTAFPVHREGKANYQSKPSRSSGIAFILFEKEAEEETERNEEEREKFIGAELVDFSRVAVLLSKFHTPRVHFSPCEQQFSIRPPLFALHCVFLI